MHVTIDAMNVWKLYSVNDNVNNVSSNARLKHQYVQEKMMNLENLEP